MQKIALAALTALALAGCATQNQDQIGNIATTPLRDLNLQQADIPDLLQDAAAKPYAMPADQACSALSSHLAALDELLGDDIDVPVSKLSNSDKARAELGKAASGALQNTVEGAIPFRGWLRKLSGAERHSRQVQEAILAGKIRRGFIKGVMQARACSLA